MLISWIYILISSYISILLLALETAGEDCLKIFYAYFIYLGNAINLTLEIPDDKCEFLKLPFKSK